MVSIRMMIISRISLAILSAIKGRVFNHVFLFCQVLLELARNRNKIPLPRSIGGPGITLPPNQDTLLGPNYHPST